MVLAHGSEIHKRSVGTVREHLGFKRGPPPAGITFGCVSKTLAYVPDEAVNASVYKVSPECLPEQ